MEEQLKKYYRKYKQDIAPTVLIIAGVILILRVVFPQISEINSALSDISTQTETNNNLRDSVSVLNSISNNELNENYDLVMSVLPSNKSVATIFENLRIAAGESNVEIGGLSVQVGTIYNQKEQQDIVESQVQGIPFLNMVVRADGANSSDLTNFANVLYELAPITEVNSIGTTEDSANYDVNFHFKPINVSAFEAQTTLSPLTAQQEELLTTLETWTR